MMLLLFVFQIDFVFYGLARFLFVYSIFVYLFVFVKCCCCLFFQIDFVAHDDLPYAAAGDDDIYKPLKEKGM